jgi:plastocyanin
MVGAADSATVGSARSGPTVGFDAGISALNGKQKKARKRAYRRCHTKHRLKARKKCRRNVTRRFRKLARKSEKPVERDTPAATVSVEDDYFSPDQVSIKRSQSVLWVWDDINHDPHNVTMISGPPGVKRQDFETATSPATKYSFQRKFTVPGTYVFACSLHYRMTITIEVS